MQPPKHYTIFTNTIPFAFTILIFLVVSCTNKPKAIPKKEEPQYYPTYTKTLADSIQTLNFVNVGWFCACPQWITPADYEKYQGTDKFTQRCYFIEPSDTILNLPDTLGYSGDLIRFTGQFYKEKGYPKYYPKTKDEDVDSARVFRYTKFQVIESHYRDFVADSSKVK